MYYKNNSSKKPSLLTGQSHKNCRFKNKKKPVIFYDHILRFLVIKFHLCISFISASIVQSNVKCIQSIYFDLKFIDLKQNLLLYFPIIVQSHTKP